MLAYKVFVYSLLLLVVSFFIQLPGIVNINDYAFATGYPESGLKSGTKIAWGGMGGYGMGGYGRLLRLGTRTLYRGRRRGYGSRRRSGEFSYNHQRINNNMQNGYLSGSSYAGNRGPGPNSQLWNRAEGRFDRRHRNNQFWNRGNRQNSNLEEAGLWGRRQSNPGQNLWGSQREMGNRGDTGMNRGGYADRPGEQNVRR